MACLHGGLIPDPAALYGEGFVRRFPFLYICILAVAFRERSGHAFDPQCVEVMCGMLTEKT